MLQRKRAQGGALRRKLFENKPGRLAGNRHLNAMGEAYLTKRHLILAFRKGVEEAVESTTSVLGYNVIEKDGWVVKVYPDGTIEKIKELKRIRRPDKFELD